METTIPPSANEGKIGEWDGYEARLALRRHFSNVA